MNPEADASEVQRQAVCRYRQRSACRQSARLGDGQCRAGRRNAASAPGKPWRKRRQVLVGTHLLEPMVWRLGLGAALSCAALPALLPRSGP